MKTKTLKGQSLAEGKTKIVYPFEGNEQKAIIQSKDDITAGDGKKHDVFSNKAILATTTTCNVFQYLLETTNIPLAYEKRLDETSFLSLNLEMIPLEVVVRGYADGSYCKRYPDTAIKGAKLEFLVSEFYLKTKDKRWGEHILPVDDPYLIFRESSICLYNPGQKFELDTKPFLELTLEDNPDLKPMFTFQSSMENFALEGFSVLQEAWEKRGIEMRDYKVEFGTNDNGQIFLGDVIDNDSWRLVKDGRYICKQAYRNGEDLAVVAENYAFVAESTKSFIEH